MLQNMDDVRCLMAVAVITGIDICWQTHMISLYPLVPSSDIWVYANGNIFDTRMPFFKVLDEHPGRFPAFSLVNLVSTTFHMISLYPLVPSSDIWVYANGNIFDTRMPFFKVLDEHPGRFPAFSLVNLVSTTFRSWTYLVFVNVLFSLVASLTRDCNQNGKTTGERDMAHSFQLPVACT